MTGKKTNLPPLVLSADLAAVIGPEPRPRSQIVKAIWLYIHAHGLQDSIDKRMVNPDAVLGRVLGTSPLSMFAMQREISKHVTPVAR